MQIVGTQRIRCYPFRKTKQYKGRTFHGKNQQDVVGIINAGTDYEDFEYPTRRKNPLDVAKVQLFFEFQLVPHENSEAAATGQDTTARAAFVQYYLPFADDRNRPLYRKDAETGNKISK